MYSFISENKQKRDEKHKNVLFSLAKHFYVPPVKHVYKHVFRQAKFAEG